MRSWLSTIDAERPVLIAGPTASGKSALALAVAAEAGGVVVNADALQVYDTWRVLTARPSAAEEAAAPHALYGHVPGDAAYSVGAWLRDVAALGRVARPIFVGGTGLYLTRLTEGLIEVPEVPPEVREAAARRDPAALLAEIDAETAATIDAANPARVRRAWEVERATGRSLAAWHRRTPPPLVPLADAHAIVLDVDRATLADRIARRAERMLDDGAVEEVAAALARHGPAAPAMKAIGAAEIAAHLAGTATREATRDRLVIATRRYAKRQRTWFRRHMRSWRPLAPG